MSLRAKLFTLVVGIFIGVFLITQVLDDVLTTSRFSRVQQDIERIIDHKATEQGQSIEKYLNEQTDWHIAAIDSLLGRVLSFEYLHQRFAPDQRTDTYNNWLSSATLLQMNKGIDLVQSTNGRSVTSLIVVGEPPSPISRPLAEVDGVLFFAVESAKVLGQWQGPFVAIPFPFNKGYPIPKDYSSDPQVLTDARNAFYLLYTIDTILHQDLEQFRTLMVNFPEYLVDMASNLSDRQTLVNVMEETLTALTQAKKVLESRPDLREKFASQNLNARLKEVLPNYQEVQEKDIEERENTLKLVETRFNQLEMIWQLAMMSETGVYHFDPFDFKAPIGITHLPYGDKAGQVIFRDEVFYRYPLFCHAGTSCGPNLDDREGTKEKEITIVYQQDTQRLFMGNMMNILGLNAEGQLQNGALLLGVDASDIVRSLALATNKTAIFVSNDHILMGYDYNGDRIEKGFDEIPINLMLGKTSGEIKTDSGEKLFYLHLDIKEKGDMHFFLLTPVEKEFEVSQFLADRTTELSENITFQTNVLALLALIIVILLVNNVVGRITKPIQTLSAATQVIGEGKLDEVNLPDLKGAPRDEVQILYTSFNHMVKELREKEKVKGVLNKVVSPTIAEEILKGKVKLGGEEKVVTVLFADIRNFTTMTEKMNPKQLIDILNKCMTKISNVIDKYDGVIDKYVGDEVMALFGAPVSSEDSALKAVLAALEIRDVIDAWNTERKDEHRPEIHMGIGIHTGLVVAGNMGAENRLNYTVLGSNVNLASRLCSAADGMHIIISEATYKSPMVAVNIEVEGLDPIELKGFSTPVLVHRVLKRHETPPDQTNGGAQ